MLAVPGSALSTFTSTLTQVDRQGAELSFANFAPPSPAVEYLGSGAFAGLSLTAVSVKKAAASTIMQRTSFGDGYHGYVLPAWPHRLRLGR